jgi:hypothetical protein
MNVPRGLVQNGATGLVNDLGRAGEKVEAGPKDG